MLCNKNNKGKKKPPEPKKDNKKKTDEELKAEALEAEKLLPPPLPLKLNNISLNFGNLKNINEFVEFNQKCRTTQLNLSVYDNICETEQSCLIDLLIGTRVNKIILHGLTFNPDKIQKIIKYLEIIEDLY